jgi:hypothetical protein
MTETTNEVALLTVRLAPEELATLAATARRNRLPADVLARVLITYGLGQLERGDKAIERAIKGSRDASVP